MKTITTKRILEHARAKTSYNNTCLNLSLCQRQLSIMALNMQEKI
jgi:hypothetical protein